MKNHWIEKREHKEYLEKKYPDHVWAGDGMIPKSMIQDKDGEWLHMIVITTAVSSHLFMDGKEIT